jgi:hypothetical protein
MTAAGIARVRACFENAEDIFPASDPRNKERTDPTEFLPQMPHLPQQQAPACRALSDLEGAFEEWAANMEYDSGIPRPLAEFLARKMMKTL